MEDLYVRQSNIIDQIKRIEVNFGKDSASRKNQEYIQKRLHALDDLWGEFEQNNSQLQSADKLHEYFQNNIYARTKEFYDKLRLMVSTYVPSTAIGENIAKPSTSSEITFDIPDVKRADKGTFPCSEADELISLQRTNFRAFRRVTKIIDINIIEEKWEIEDILKNLQHRWQVIDDLHLRIDNILQGTDKFYESEFYDIETSYNTIKRELNKKLCFTTHLQQSTPKIEIPTFMGKYTQWPTFFDLFKGAIHDNSNLTKAQKMQHLKGKVKGEAERLIQHLYITSENYDTAWDILTHRYNNPQAIFTHQIEILLSQPNITKQSSFELKRMHDVTMECIHAIHNLGVDTTTWDPLLVHLLAKKLDVETYSHYKESRKSPRDLASFDEFMGFIESKFTALEPLHQKERQPAIPKQMLPYQQSKNAYNKNYNYQGRSPYKNYHAGATYTSTCPLCNYSHDLYQCKRFLSMPMDVKMKSIAKLEVCQNCLYKHHDKCNSTKRCKQCNGNHNTLIHDGAVQFTASSPTSTNTSLRPQPTVMTKPVLTQYTNSAKQFNTNFVVNENEEVLLPTTLLKVKAADGTYITLRIFLDQGSQISILSENAAQRLGLQRNHCHASVSSIGGPRQTRGMVTLECKSIYDDYQFTTDAVIMSRFINNLPNATFQNKSYQHLQNINLGDPEYNISRPIDILLDSSVYSELLVDGLIKGPAEAPIAQQTKIGWILSGNVKRETFSYNCHMVLNNLVDITKYWEIEGIEENKSSSQFTKEEQYCEDFYHATTRRLEDGRYEVALPMKQDFEQHLGISKPKAVAQYKQLENKMSKNKALSDKYKQFMYEYEQLGHMRKAHIIKEPTYYLPHHGVLKLESSTTALRVVFNGSAKTSSGKSLNDLMECGPNLQKDLQTLILQWRQYRYVLTADIEKMYRQFMIRESDQPLQSIIWSDGSYQGHLQEYHLTTVTYGTKAAPYLAIRTLKQIARDHSEQYSLAASALEHSFYVDDYLGGHNVIHKAKELQSQLIHVLKGAGMNIRKWSSNEPELISDLSSDQVDAPYEFKDSESRKTLGLKWHPSSDSFTFQNKLNPNEMSNTKRKLLSDISKLYDPLGWLSPVTISAKTLFQRTWLSDLSWDEELPTDILNQWLQLRDDLENIEKISMPRYVGNTENGYQLHGFCDASEKAYACAIYIVTCDNKGTCTSMLMTAKTKVAPHNKKLSLPRLELLGALLLADLMKKVKISLSAENIKTTAWTDSMVVLGWLHGDISRWKTFVANRVQSITDIIPASCWHHVKSEENAADCATRGISTANLSKHSLWWEGPEWLTTFIPENINAKTYQSPAIELKKVHSVNTALHTNRSFLFDLLNTNSSITKVVKIIAWMSRFVERLRNKQVASTRKYALTAVEIQAAYNLLIKTIQALEFEGDLQDLKTKGQVKHSSKLSSLHPFLDKQGILRVGGRLENAEITYAAKHPVILSSHSRLTELIIEQAHKTTLHGGPRLTLSYIRDTFWIISGIRTVKKQIRLCVICRRFNQERSNQLMADLPKARVIPARPFTNTGVDFTGHVDIKMNKGRGIKTMKGYIAVFVCLVTKAVHLELVSDLSTSAFLAAFRRMCARRGTPNNMYSDNGTNFVGAARLLKQEYKEILATLNTDCINNISEMGVTWHFNAPAWPSAGGLWEAAVKSFKYHMKRVLGEQRLTYEEFSTLLHQIEACMNSRPLCSLTESPDDLYLTPGHFLVSGPLLSRPQTDPSSATLSTRWQQVQAKNKQFWKKWSSEYLQQLQVRSKWRTTTEDLKLNDVVIIKEDNMPPGKWAVGRVQELHIGKDGHVRVVSLKTQNNTIKRPITKLIPLPISKTTPVNHDSSDEATPTPTASQRFPARRQRRQRNNLFKNYFITLLMMITSIIMPTTSMQLSSKFYNISDIRGQNGFYYDNFSELRHIRDEWKVIVYYNLSTYWDGLADISNYVTHLKSLCNKESRQYDNILLQLQNEIKEIKQYNKVLKAQNTRQKRGLINGVGYIAHTLFGVLDESFADQYKKDIEKIALNENHIQNLIKNQTLVIESQYDLVRQNEDIMNRQFAIIRESYSNLTMAVNQVHHDSLSGLHILSSALTANIIISSLRRIQGTLINTVEDITHGRIDTHLFPPKQLEAQYTFIKGQLSSDMELPVEQSNINELYKLMRTSARVFDEYIIMEIKLPIISNEVYELDKIVSIPQIRGQRVYYLIPAFPYIAFNLKKESIILMTEHNLKSCIHTSKNKILCSIEEPIYALNTKQSLCDLKLVNTEIEQSPCHTSISTCTDNKWIKLHSQNVWLFSCCQQCEVRIFCATGRVIRNLTNVGLITLGQGCELRSESDKFTWYTHNHFLNHMNKQIERIAVPEISDLNDLMKTDIAFYDEDPIVNHTQNWINLKAQIETMKKESAKQLTIHDVHHYSCIYIIAVGLLILVMVTLYCWFRKGRLQRSDAVAIEMQQQQPSGTTTVSRTARVVHTDQGTSPIIFRPVQFDVPLS